MNPEEIKIGDKVLVEAEVYRLHSDGDVSCYTRRLSCTGKIMRDHLLALSCDIRPFCPAPKYDPCRRFRKGDKVQVKKRDGRCNGKEGVYLCEAFCTVFEDETQNELVRVLHNATEYRLDPAYLELVQPVEELEPYYVDDSTSISFDICWRETGDNLATYWFNDPPRTYTQEDAKEAAQAECDRLNAEYRAQNAEDRKEEK